MENAVDHTRHDSYLNAKVELDPKVLFLSSTPIPTEGEAYHEHIDVNASHFRHGTFPGLLKLLLPSTRACSLSVNRRLKVAQASKTHKRDIIAIIVIFLRIDTFLHLPTDSQHPLRISLSPFPSEFQIFQQAVLGLQ